LIRSHEASNKYFQAEVLPSKTAETMALAFGAMVVVAFFLIPDWSGIFVVTCSILSVQLGVVGYMTLWGVYYDLFSMVVLIMSIGFSVDFCAHTAYAFYSQKSSDKTGETEKSAVEKLGIGLTHVGLPILQGTTSTVIAVSGLLLTGYYAHVMFFKVIFLIMTIGALHAIMFLPVCMLIFDSLCQNFGTRANGHDDYHSSSMAAPAGDGFEPTSRDTFLPQPPRPPSYEQSTLRRQNVDYSP
jgi:multidrug efflux pump subunit AcrB